MNTEYESPSIAIFRLLDEYEKLKQDKERLDWLDSKSCVARLSAMGSGFGKTVREAIDAAIEAEQTKNP